MCLVWSQCHMTSQGCLNDTDETNASSRLQHAPFKGYRNRNPSRTRQNAHIANVTRYQRKNSPCFRMLHAAPELTPSFLSVLIGINPCHESSPCTLTTPQLMIGCHLWHRHHQYRIILRDAELRTQLPTSSCSFPTMRTTA